MSHTEIPVFLSYLVKHNYTQTKNNFLRYPAAGRTLFRTITRINRRATDHPQADKPRRRGMVITLSLVKQRALELGLCVRSPEKMKNSMEEIMLKQLNLSLSK